MPYSMAPLAGASKWAHDSTTPALYAPCVTEALPQLRTGLLTVLALVGFAGNSLLCRMALGGHAIDAFSFTSLRLLSGAITLAIIASLGRVTPTFIRAGSTRGALALFAYAMGFSIAYLKLSTGTGALILFGCVQLTMFGASLRGAHRPRAGEWFGLALAFAGLVALTLPGVSAPDPLGALSMALAGVAWGVYSLLGRGSISPLATTAGNFARSAPLALAVSAFTLRDAQVTLEGVLLAGASGALASGVGYSLWYAALPKLSSARAGIIQLTVPLLAALLGVVFVGEALTIRWCLAALAILGGVLLVFRVR
jgi:drug/metabolite transporter (DMT)-like permease